MLIKIKNDEKNAAGLKKQAMNQSGFVTSIIEQSSSKDAKIEELEVKIKRNEALLKQLQNNTNEYHKLLDKYNALVEKITGENRKNV